MSHQAKSYLLVLVLAVSSYCYLPAQNATSSPSSRFGYGELNDNIPVPYRAMGGVSAGLRRNNAINMAQPASYTACDTMTFMFDVAVSAMWTNYSDMNGKRNRPNGNLEYVTLQIPLWKQHIAFAAGIMPYSSVGYDFAVADSTGTGGHPYTLDYEGEGGIAEVCAGISFNILDWVALGANFYYMFGDVTNVTELSFRESGLTGSMMYKNMEVRSFRMRYGAQFFHTFGRHNVTLGAVVEHKQRLNSEYLQYELYTLDSVTVQSSGFQTPLYYNVGASYCFRDRLTLAFDYACQRWSDARYFGATGQFGDRHRYALGVEYRHNPLSRNYAERMYWRLGGSLVESYTRFDDRKDFSVSLGMGFPLRTAATIINLAVEYNRRHPMAQMTENNLKLTLGIGVNETWFFKRKL